MADAEFAAFDSETFSALDFVNTLFPNGAGRAHARASDAQATSPAALTRRVWWQRRRWAAWSR